MIYSPPFNESSSLLEDLKLGQDLELVEIKIRGVRFCPASLGLGGSRVTEFCRDSSCILPARQSGLFQPHNERVE